MTVIHDLPTLRLLLDLDLLDTNPQRMADKARTLGVALRPHFKTRKCVEVTSGSLSWARAASRCRQTLKPDPNSTLAKRPKLALFCVQIPALGILHPRR